MATIARILFLLIIEPFQWNKRAIAFSLISTLDL